jgi:dimethylargininase
MPSKFSATRAIVRCVSPRLGEGEVTHRERVPVDLERAFAQHAAYVDVLREHGLQIIEAPELPEHPDGVFVEDVLVVIAGQPILTRPGAPSRRGELDGLEPLIAALGLACERIEAPATLDGGDVLVTPRHVLVGQSTRSNQEAVRQLAASASCLEREVRSVEVHAALHLKSAVTLLPDGSLIAAPGFVDAEALEALGYQVHEAPEATGANVLWLDRSVVLPADAPATAALLRTLGFGVLSIDIGELQKLEAGVTCMSVLL